MSNVGNKFYQTATPNKNQRHIFMPCNCRRGLGPHDHIGDAISLENGSVASSVALLALGISLNPLIDTHAVEFWNAKGSPEQCAATLFLSTSDDGRVVSSDADTELLVWVPFRESVRIRGVSIDGSNDAFAPLKVHLFANRGRSDITGFDSVARLKPDETLLLSGSSSHQDAIVYRVNPIKFQSVDAMVLHFPGEIAGGDSEEETHVSRVVFYGESSGRTTERLVATNLVYESSANPADHKLLEDGTKATYAVM